MTFNSEMRRKSVWIQNGSSKFEISLRGDWPQCKLHENGLLHCSCPVSSAVVDSCPLCLASPFVSSHLLSSVAIISNVGGTVM